MVAELSKIKLSEPSYYHREYQNDIKKRDPNDQSACNQFLRVARVSLPFIALYKPAGQPLSLLTGGYRTISCLSITYGAISQGKCKSEIASDVLQTAVSIVALGGSIFGHPLGMLVTTCHDLGINIIHLHQAWVENDSTKALESGLQILNNSTYLGMFFVGSTEILVASLALQILSGLYQTSGEFKKGNYLEVGAGILMATIRLNQMTQPISLLQAKWKLESLSKKAANMQAIANSNTAKSDINGSNTIPQEVIEILVKYGNNPLGIPALHYAIVKDDILAIKLLLDHGASVHALSQPAKIYGGNVQAPLLPLDYAAVNGNIRIMQLLIDYGADANYIKINGKNDDQSIRYYSALFFAAEADKDEAIRFLISKGANLAPDPKLTDKYGSSQGNYNPLCIAVQNGSTKAFKALLDCGAVVGPLIYDQPYLFHTAANLGHDKIVQMLLDQDVYVDARAEKWGDRTALMGATGKCVELLLNAGANPKLTDKGGLSALFQAAMRCDLEATKLLIKFGADINQKTPTKDTLFYLASMHWSPSPWSISLDSLKKYLQFLLDHGADINAVNDYGCTALSRAASGQYFELVEWLKSHGAK